MDPPHPPAPADDPPALDATGVQLAPTEAQETQPGANIEQVANAMPNTLPGDEQVAAVSTAPSPTPEEPEPAVDERQMAMSSKLLMVLLATVAALAAFTGDALLDSAATLVQGMLSHNGNVDAAPAAKKRPIDPYAPKQKRAKRPKDPDMVTCHEEANRIPRTLAVQCTNVKCSTWFSRTSLINKFGLDIPGVTNSPEWTCPHCEGICALCSCVRKRENMVAGQIEARLSGVNYTDDPSAKPPALSSVQWIRRAKAAGHASVRAYVAEAWPGLAWE